MKRIKEIWNNISKKIKKSNVARLLRFRATINDLENKIQQLERDKQLLIDKVNAANIKLQKLEELENKLPSMEIVIASSDKSIKNKMVEINQLKDEKVKLQSELFEIKLELGTVYAQMEEYKLQIQELKSDRYLIKKIPSGRKPNTNKTKISKPMSARVTKYMRGEHE